MTNTATPRRNNSQKTLRKRKLPIYKMNESESQTKRENWWECRYCERTLDIENAKGITTHIGRVHNETNITNLKCPYCPATFKNLENTKRHILYTSCANNQHKHQPLRWGEIANANTNDENENEEWATICAKSTFGRTGLLFKRIAIMNTPSGTSWKCECDNCIYNTDEKDRIRNRIAPVRRETNTRIVYCPYCEKKHIS